MPRNRIKTEEKAPELVAAEAQASAMLRQYLRSLVGRNAAIARATGIYAPSLSRMGTGKHPITLDSAVLLEVASEGELRAELLCPSRADLIGKFLALRTSEAGKVAA